ncbi:MAG: hypothetical protein AB1567_08860 [bacterium]
MAVVVVLFAGCATTPDWVRKGAGAFKEKDKVFYGQGMATAKIKDKALRQESADNRARADLQRVFDTYTAYLMKDYAGMDGQLIERACKTFSAGHISGAQIVDRWTERDGTIHSLIKLDLATFKEAMELAKELSDTAREHIQKKADAMFDELQREEEKH